MKVVDYCIPCSFPARTINGLDFPSTSKIVKSDRSTAESQLVETEFVVSQFV